MHIALMSLRATLVMWALAGAGLSSWAATTPSEYPTVDRVLYVNRCVRDNPGPPFEMVNKCACVFDRLAQQMPHEDFVGMSTAADANRIGGERGSYIREVPALQQQIRRWNSLQNEALVYCQVKPRS